MLDFESYFRLFCSYLSIEVMNFLGFYLYIGITLSVYIVTYSTHFATREVCQSSRSQVG